MASETIYLDVQNLTKRFGERLLFNRICFSIAEGDRVGLIAKNGTGKSTLLNILTGKEGKDEGDITFRNNIQIGYLEQSPVYPEGMTVMEACFYHGNEITRLIKEYEKCMTTEGNPGLDDLLSQMEQLKAWDYERKAKEILSKLKINDFDQPISQLSGGQVKRVALANVLITEPDLIILDEPTNHLDLDMVEWLEEYLNKGKLSLLMVTHDRYFLDNVCSEILELDNQTIYTYKGNYEYYLEKREQRMTAEDARTAHARNLYRTELDWMRRMPCARGHKARYRKEAFYELEKVAKRRVQENNVTLTGGSSYIGNKIFEAEHLSKSFGPDKIILKDFSYVFSRYEKMGIVGNNGTGKSTFIKMLLGLVKPDSGKLEIGETVRFGYYSQEGLQFKEDEKVIDIIRKIAEYVEVDGHRISAGQFLQQFLFSPEEQYNYVAKLSGGERRRLYLCTILIKNPNFLVLDEPTNDLDIITLQVLEEYLQKFKGCAIIVSHDRYFMDKVVDHLLVFRGQGDIRDFPGNYSQYREWKDAKEQHDRELEKEKEKEIKVKTEDKPRREHSSAKKRMTYKERMEYRQLGKDIEALEKEKKDIETALCSGTLSVDELTEKSKRLPLLSDELDEKSMRWLELSELQE